MICENKITHHFSNDCILISFTTVPPYQTQTTAPQLTQVLWRRSLLCQKNWWMPALTTVVSSMITISGPLDMSIEPHARCAWDAWTSFDGACNEIETVWGTTVPPNFRTSDGLESDHLSNIGALFWLESRKIRKLGLISCQFVISNYEISGAELLIAFTTEQCDSRWIYAGDYHCYCYWRSCGHRCSHCHQRSRCYWCPRSLLNCSSHHVS